MTYDELLKQLDNPQEFYEMPEKTGGARSKSRRATLSGLTAAKLKGKIFINNILPTLGYRSTFGFIDNAGVLTVINRPGTIMPVSRKLYAAVWKRFKSLPVIQRYRTTNYTDTSWPQCPSRILSAYLPAIWRYFGL